MSEKDTSRELKIDKLEKASSSLKNRFSTAKNFQVANVDYEFHESQNR